MKKLWHVLPYILLAYAALYGAIWLHELGHSIAYYYFDCKSDLLHLHVPAHFANANPYPINETRTATLESWQQFYISMAGIGMNIVLALGTWLLSQIPFDTPRLLHFFGSFFLLSNLIEAATYLTVSNIYPTGDLLEVHRYNPALCLPLLFLGLLLIYAIVALVAKAPRPWQRSMVIFSIIAALCMSGLRILFDH